MCAINKEMDASSLASWILQFSLVNAGLLTKEQASQPT